MNALAVISRLVVAAGDPLAPRNAAERVGYVIGQLFCCFVVVAAIVGLVVFLVRRNKQPPEQKPPPPAT